MWTPTRWQIPSARPGHKSHRRQKANQVPAKGCRGWQTTKSKIARPLLACVHLRCFLNQNFHSTGLRINHAHVVPVICKLFAATKTYKISPCNRCHVGALLSLAAGNQRRAFLCRQAKTLDQASWNNSITTKHLSLGEPRRV